MSTRFPWLSDERIIQLLEYFFDAIILLELFALANYLLLGIIPVTPFQSMAELENRWYQALSPASPYMALIVMFSWVKYLKPGSRTESTAINKESRKTGETSNQTLKIIFVLALLVALLGSVYVWLPAVNPEREQLGVDTKGYIKSLNITTASLSDVFATPNWGRITIRLIVFGIRSTTSFDVADIVTYLPVALNPILVAATYFMVQRGSGDTELAAYSALAMAMGYNLTVGTFAFYLANNLSMFFLFMSLGYLLKDLRKGSTSLNLKSLLFGVLVPFTHTYTFYQFYGALLLLLVYKIIRRVNLSQLSPLILYLAILGMLVFTQKIVLPEKPGDDDIRVVSGYTFTPLRFHESSVFTFKELYTGLMGNTVFLLTSAYGAFYLNKDKEFDQFLLLSLVATSIVYGFSHMITRQMSSTSYLPSRLLYNTLLAVFSGYAAKQLRLYRELPENLGDKAVCAFYLSMATYLFRSLYELVPH